MKRGLAWASLQGLLSAGLLAWLASSAEAPSGPLLLPIAREDYYVWEAALVWPWRVAMALTFAGVATPLAHKLGGRGDFGSTFDEGAFALALPFLLLWWLPDVALYATGGFDALRSGVRVVAPLATTATWVLATLAMRRAHELSTPRATLVAFVGLVAQATLGALVLR
ncbi:MAG: hypothetical protein H6721_06020 [Sandaracinus sp.]|nr:hypothetical protein [Sandaracinus sp.]MCB9631681.1 hypothetical protein [Sandaracinus sp.]